MKWKVYSWSNLCSAVIVGGCWLFLAIRGRNPLLGLVWLGVIVWGLYTSLTKEGYEKENERRQRQGRAAERAFGRWASLMLYVPYLALMGGLVVISLLPIDTLWWHLHGKVYAMFALLAVVAAYMIWYYWMVKKYEDPDKREQEEKGEEP